MKNNQKRKPKPTLAKEDLERLDAMEALENVGDIREAKLALQEIKEKGSISFREMKKRIG